MFYVTPASIAEADFVVGRFVIGLPGALPVRIAFEPSPAMAIHPGTPRAPRSSSSEAAAIGGRRHAPAGARTRLATRENGTEVASRVHGKVVHRPSSGELQPALNDTLQPASGEPPLPGGI
jgi:hypothetical protein